MTSTTSPTARSKIVSARCALPSPECEVFIGQLGGAMTRVAADATAYPHRTAQFVMNVHTRWRERGAGRGLHRLGPRPLRGGGALRAGQRLRELHARRGRGSDSVESAYGADYRRLAGIKRRYDPDNRFRMNQNIHPSAEWRKT